ncbi:hypothetical protein MMC25_003574 [Agyrium rufum]|nr:hypothetical protein [Agyrium rufum]
MSGLPVGLVTNTDAITGNIEQVDRVEVEDLTQFWKVYSANQNLLAENRGKRLENFFWRIWGNRRLREKISGTQIASIFQTISEGDAVIRTTPTQSPRSRQSPGPGREDVEPPHLHQRAGNSSGALPPASQATPNEKAIESHSPDSDVDRTEASPAKEISRRPPILKKGSSTQQFKTARILTSDIERSNDDQHLQGDHTGFEPISASAGEDALETNVPRVRIGDTEYRDPVTSPVISLGSKKKASPPPPHRAAEVTKTKNKKSTFVVSTGANKRRPTITRRKSSQSSGGTGNTTPKQPVRALPARFLDPNTAASRSLPQRSNLLPPLPGRDESTPLPTPPEPKIDYSYHPPRFQPSHFDPARFERRSPRSSKPPSARSSRSASPVLSRPPGTQSSWDAPTPNWLVENDFKAKFAHKMRLRAEAATAGSATASPVTVVAANTQIPESNSEKSKGTSIMILGRDDDDDEQAEEEEEVNREDPATSAIDEDDSDEEFVATVPAVLQKSKSQLTLLLEKERRRGLGRETGRDMKGKARY